MVALDERPVRARGSARQILSHPLSSVLAVAAVLGLIWALLVPPWQSPDETWHFAYAQSLAERFALPGNPTRAAYSSDESLALQAVGALPLTFHPGQARPSWSHAAEQRYLRSAPGVSRSDGGGFNIESSNPPLLYLFDDLPYWVSSSGSAFARLYAMRVWNVLLLLATVTGAWLLAGEIFGRRRLPQLLCAATVGLLPMQTFIGTSVNPDAMLVPLWTLALWMGVRVIRRGARAPDVAWLSALTAAAILTKATSYALVPPALVALGLGWLRRPAGERTAAARRLSPILLLLVGPVLGWVALTQALERPTVNVISAPVGGPPPRPFTPGGFISYLAHFYIPHLPLLSGFAPVTGTPAYRAWVQGGWGEFGWLDVTMPSWVYRVLAVLTLVIVLAVLRYLVAIRDRPRVELLGFLAVALGSLLLLLHVTDYRSILAGNGHLIQGRYLLPLSSLFGVGLALLSVRLPARWRGVFCAAVIGGGLVLQLLALGTIARTYYT